MASNYVDLYHNVDNDTMTEQEGLELHGRDGVFCTSPVYADIPLLTENQDLARAINELFGQGTGAITGDFRAVIDNNAAIVQIVLENDGYSDNTYGYSFDVWSDEIKTETTVGETTTTTTQTFEKRIITQLFNSDGELLLGTEYNSDTGDITRYYDGSDTDIHLTEWRTEAVESKEMSAKAEVAAIAWCIARNFEQSQSLAIQKKMYRKGLKQGVEGGADIKEPWNTDDTTIDIPVDEDGYSDGDVGLTDLNNGITARYENPSDPTDAITIKIYIEHDNDNDHGSYGRTGYLVVKKYNSAGEELGVHQSSFLSGSGSKAYHVQWNTANSGYPRYFTNYKMEITATGGRVRGYFVTPKAEGWTTGSSGVGGVTNPFWSIPDGYVYVGTSNI